MSASFSFRPADSYTERHGLFVALVGSTNTGKSFSALRLARGIAGPTGKVAVLDTEAGRTLHLKQHFQFDVLLQDPPHRPERYYEAAVAAQEAGYACLVIDSFTAAWRGVGGCLDWIDEELEVAVNRSRATAERYNRPFDEAYTRTSQKSAASIRPKMAWKRMVFGFLGLKMPVIFAIRGEETYDPEKKSKIYKAQIQSNFLFEVTVSFRLAADRKGVVDLSDPSSWKMEGDHRTIFRDGDQLSEDHGAALAAWAAGGMAPAAPQPPQDRAAAGAAAMMTEIADAPDMQSLLLLVDRTLTQRQWLEKNRPELHAEVTTALRDRHDRLADDEVPSA